MFYKGGRQEGGQNSKLLIENVACSTIVAWIVNIESKGGQLGIDKIFF